MKALTLILLSCTLSGPEGTPSLEDVLARTAKSVERFWNQFPAVNCTERVTQEKLGKEGKTVYRHDAAFDYMIFLDLQGEDLSVEESRLMQKEMGKTQNLPLLLTSGFSTLLLVFHPYYQGSFEYQRLEDETIAGHRLMRISYRHIHGTRSTSALRLRGQDYPLDLEGTAWVDPETWVIERIDARLVSPLEDLNLRLLNATVRYAPQHFPSVNEAEWLPVEASIDVETARQHWRNIHRFEGYRQFSVKSESVVIK
jgi:hypothetical protein